MALLRALEDVDQADTNELATTVRHPASTTRRALEDLTAHGLVEQHRAPKGEAHEWSLSEFSRSRLAAFPLNNALSRKVVEHAEREKREHPTFREHPVSPPSRPILAAPECPKHGSSRHWRSKLDNLRCAECIPPLNEYAVVEWLEAAS
jgi:IclR helix-turn-helix domain